MSCHEVLERLRKKNPDERVSLPAGEVVITTVAVVGSMCGRHSFDVQN